MLSASADAWCRTLGNYAPRSLRAAVEAPREPAPAVASMGNGENLNRKWGTGNGERAPRRDWAA
jgi:hypothetical protein